MSNYFTCSHSGCESSWTNSFCGKTGKDCNEYVGCDKFVACQFQIPTNSSEGYHAFFCGNHAKEDIVLMIYNGKNASWTKNVCRKCLPLAVKKGATIVEQK